MRRPNLPVLALLLAAACPGPKPASTPVAATSAPATSLRVVSMASTPPASMSGGSWRFADGTRTFDLKVSLEGRGEFKIAVEITRQPGGEVVHRDDQVQTLDGKLDLTFPKLEMPARGGYTMTLEVDGAGLRQRSQVTLRN